MTMPTSISVNLNDIQAARSAIREYVNLTPCNLSPRLSARTDCMLHLKMENLQRTGAYKDRGAMNTVLSLTDAQKKAGVIAASAGNHAQGLAFAAQRNNTHATIVMPETAPIAKFRGTEQYGAEIVVHGNGYDDAFGRATELQKEKGYTFVHAFDDPRVIAGQGTVGLEFLEHNPYLEVFVVPIGGGGLVAGMALALKEVNPRMRIVGVQAESIASMKASVEAGKIVSVAGTKVAGIAGKQVCVVLTGGNIDTTLLAKVLERGLAKDGRLAKLSILVPDRPGSMADLAGIAASHQANILDIHHRRTFNSAQLRETEVELLVETRGPAQVQALLQAIAAKGYEAQSFAFE